MESITMAKEQSELPKKRFTVNATFNTYKPGKLSDTRVCGGRCASNFSVPKNISPFNSFSSGCHSLTLM